jgi:L-aminopeptidase/D-esterase-like protein
MPNQTITVVRGLQVGHAHDLSARTGCTVLLGPFRGAVHIAGFATGTRELDVLSPTHLAPRIDALLLTGGSAFGLAAADGVVRWLHERGRGFDTQHARVPLVPAAVIYDLNVGDPERRPDAQMGYAASQAANGDPVIEGAVGVGAGASVGKLLGPANACASGVGSWCSTAAGYQVGAFVVVNALGDVFSSNGEVLAGARLEDGRFANAMTLLRTQETVPAPEWEETNTTLAVIATDAPLGRTELLAFARQGANALARRIAPVFTPFDGDVIFALSTATELRELDPTIRLALGAAAQDALEVAIERAVTVGSRTDNVSRRTVSG